LLTVQVIVDNHPYYPVNLGFDGTDVYPENSRMTHSGFEDY